MNLVTDLSQLPTAFAERFNARDIEGLLALNEPEAVFVPAPGNPVDGEPGIRAALEQFLELQLPITMNVRRSYSVEEVGFVMADWSIEGAGPDGSPIALAGTTADVARFEPGAGWRYVIDNPFGTV